LFGVLLSLVFIIGGLIPIAVGFSMRARGVTGDDVLAEFIIGGALMLIGGLILWAAVHGRKRINALNAEAAAAVIAAQVLNTDFSDDFIDDIDD